MSESNEDFSFKKKQTPIKEIKSSSNVMLNYDPA
jgi:hypothetical protein